MDAGQTDMATLIKMNDWSYGPSKIFIDVDVGYYVDNQLSYDKDVRQSNANQEVVEKFLEYHSYRTPIRCHGESHPEIWLVKERLKVLSEERLSKGR